MSSSLFTVMACVTAAAAVVVLGQPRHAIGRRRLARVARGAEARRSSDAAAELGAVRTTMPTSSPTGDSQTSRSPVLASAIGRRVAVGVAALALALGVGGWLGFAVAAVGAVGLDRLLVRLRSSSVDRGHQRMVADLPVAVDLLAACLRAGRPTSTAVAAVARGVGGPLGDRLALVAAASRLGADVPSAWSDLDQDPALAPLASAMARTADSGAGLARTLDRVAEDSRRASRAAARERARAVGVKAAAPLGVCFLPAFLLIGVVPVIASAFSGLVLSW